MPAAMDSSISGLRDALQRDGLLCLGQPSELRRRFAGDLFEQRIER